MQISQEVLRIVPLAAAVIRAARAEQKWRAAVEPATAWMIGTKKP